MKSKDEHLEREINCMLQEIKDASEKLNSKVYQKMIGDLQLVRNNNLIEYAKIILNTRNELKLPTCEASKEFEKILLD